MKTTLDPREQRYEAQVNRARRTERDLSEMLGLAKGMLADGVVSDDEAREVRGWGANHPETLERWPVNLIFTRLNQYFADGRIDESERAELHDLRRALVASGADHRQRLDINVVQIAIVCEERTEVSRGRMCL